MLASWLLQVARLGCFAGTLTAMSFAYQIAKGHDESQEELLLGCWKRTSPYPRDQIPPDQHEWGTATWCFEKDGRIITRTIACGRSGGCDGWEDEREYRWRENLLEILVLDLDRNSSTHTWVWRACRPTFVRRERMSLQNCPFSTREWVREHKAD
jgi:hypothetical protein